MFFRFRRPHKKLPSAQSFKQQGDLHLSQSDALAAEHNCRLALDLDPTHAETLVSLGSALAEQGRLEEASKSVERALALEPGIPNARFMLARFAVLRGDLEGADVHFRDALLLQPEVEFAYFEYGMVLVGLGGVERALQLAIAGTERFPQNANLHRYLGDLYYRTGNFDAAANCFEHALSIAQGDFSIMAALADALLAKGDAAGAAAMAHELLSLAPQYNSARLVLAQALEKLNDTDSAIAHYSAYLEGNPEDAFAGVALLNVLLRLQKFDQALALADTSTLAAASMLSVRFTFAHAMQQSGRLDLAIRFYEKVLEIDVAHEESLINLGLALYAKGENNEAVTYLRHASMLTPQHPVAHLGLAAALFNVGELADAIISARRAVEIAPGNIDACLLLGDILRCQGKFSDAAAQFRAALDIESATDTQRAATQRKLGEVLLTMKQADAAVLHLRKAVAHASRDGQAQLLLGSALIQSGRCTEAIEVLQQMIDTEPRAVPAHTLMGSALAELGRYSEARAAYEQALALEPDYVDAKASHGLLCLLLGDFERGWEGYRHLTRQTGMLALPDFARPLWLNDADLSGKSILLFADQGMGDAINFARYIEKIAAQCSEIYLAVQAPLVSLMRSLRHRVYVVDKNEPLPATDFFCPLAQLPLAFGTRLDTIPAGGPYLYPPPERAAYWQDKLRAYSAPRVGLVWSGNSVFTGDHDRSIPFQLMAQTLSESACSFFSVQKDPRPGDADALRSAHQIVDLGPSLTDFAETAAIIENLDLVVTVDTSVAHLSGAMGKKVWIMLPFSPDFRWLLDRDDSPWYPSARLFRQGSKGDWAAVLQQVASALAIEFESTQLPFTSL